LNAHVDSVRFSGDIVAGLSLMSSSIMRLREEKQELVSSQRKQTKDEPYVDLFLQERSLYVLEGYSRYRYTHELLPSGSTFGDKVVHRENRLSIIFRDSK
jgi:alkylated DNA repair protein alkB family protein 7